MERKQIQGEPPQDGQLILAFGNILDDFGNFVQRGYGIIEYKNGPDTLKHWGLPQGGYFINHIEHYYIIG